jgi:hypothetical protein
MTVGKALMELRQRSGLTLEEVSTLAGYRGRSSVQQFFREDYDPGLLEVRVATRLAAAFVGRGSPMITEQDILDLTTKKGEIPVTESDMPFGIPIGKIPVFTAKRAKPVTFEGAEAPTEAMSYDQANPIGYAWFPPDRDTSKRAYCLYLGSNAMSPRYSRGEMVVVEELRAAKVNDDVVIQVDEAERGEKFFTHAVLGQIADFEMDGILLRTLNPAVTIAVPYDRILRIERIMPLHEILAP